MMKNQLSKVCPICKRPFNWRKKWKKNWNEVLYCSKKCRANRSHLKNI